MLVTVYLSVQFTSAAVSRRYKQFDWLQQRLVEKFSTIAIPPLPEKQIAGKMNGIYLMQTLCIQKWQDFVDAFCTVK